MVTGRPPRWIDALRDELLSCGLYKRSDEPALVIALNGALIYDALEGAIVEEHRIDASTVQEVVRRALSISSQLRFAAELGNGFAVEPDFPAKWALPNDVRVDPIADFAADGVTKLLVRSIGDLSEAAAADVVHSIVSIAEAAWIYDGRSDSLLIEAQALGIDKASTLKTLVEAKGLSARDVVAFGDMPNDIPMLRWAGRSVAMGNAHPEVKEVADHVTLSDEDDGVGVAIAALLLAPDAPWRHRPCQ